MSVTDTSQNNNGKNTQQSAQPFAPGRAKSSVAAFNSMFKAPVAYSKSGDALNKFHEAFDESLKKIQNGVAGKFKLLALDTSDISGAVQLIVLYAEDNGLVAFNSFILESTLRSPLQDRVIKGVIGSPEIRIPTNVGELYTQDMSAYVVAALSKVTNVSSKHIADAGAITIYKELDYESEVHVHTLLWRAANSIQDMFNSQDAELPRLNLHQFKTAKFTGRVDFTPGLGETSSGLPVRRDVAISVEMTDTSHEGFDPTEFSQNSAQLVRVGGYLDMRFVGQRPFNPQMQMMGQVFLPTQIYQPTLYITDTNTVANQINLELQLFSISEFTHLSRGGHKRWVNMLRPRYGNNPEVAKLRNFKGFQHEVGADVINDPDAPNFNLLEEVNKIAHPSLAHILLCETTSDLSWIHTIFRMAAVGDADAITAIRNAADNVSNGNFSATFPEGTPIGQIENDLILLGYWMSGEEKRPLQDIDNLAIWNLCGENDPALAVAYSDTFNSSKGVIQERLAKRIEILRQIFQGSIRITGTATPVILNPTFLVALANAINKAGVTVQYEENNSILGSNDRSNYALLAFALDPSQLNMSANMNMGGLTYNPYGAFMGNRFGGFGV